MKIRSAPDAPTIVPPVMTLLLAATVEPTSTPPELMVLVPVASVTVFAAAKLKRSEFTVMFPTIWPALVVTSMLPV